MSVNIAIDGPAGAGKSTIAKILAQKIGYIYVDTGAMYRAMALFFLRNNVNSQDFNKISKLCNDIDISIDFHNEEQIVLLNGENVNSFIRSEEVGNMASSISVLQCVREKLLSLQQNLAKSKNIIMDGRDIGSCVLPNADFKIYLTASSYIRAKRRYNELKAKNVDCNLETIEEDIIERDNRDMNREIAPLKQADDAVLIDSSEMNLEEVVDKIISIIESK